MNKTKNELYIMQMKNHVINNLNKPAYLYKDTPETILINAGIIRSHAHERTIRKEQLENPLSYTGIDIVQVDDNSYTIIKCKDCRKKAVTKDQLAYFMFMMSVIDKINGCVYYTYKLSPFVLRFSLKSKRIKYIKFKHEKEEQQENGFDNEKLIYHKNVCDLAAKYYEKNNKGIISMPCTMEKTYTSYLITNDFKQIIFFSPLKQYAEQNLKKIIEYGYKNNYLLVSDGEQNINEIKKIITNEKFFISATFDSIDVIYESLKYMDNPFIIVDEFHNLSKTNVSDKKDNFYKLLNSEYRMLFTSATPKVYEIENTDLFGEKIYNMTLNEAIEKKYICDYKVWLPSIHEDNEKLNSELNIYNMDNTIKSKCVFLFSCMLNHGARKCIVYCTDTKEIDVMMKAVGELNKYYLLDIEMNEISNDNDDKIRETVLSNFANSDKLFLLFSVRILDECIDTPYCDSIFITEPSKNKVRTIQQICRCIGIDKNNKFKMSNVFMWCDDYDRIWETLLEIKEHDCEFKDKIKVNQNDFFGDNDKNKFVDDVKLVEKIVNNIMDFTQITIEERMNKIKS